MSNSDRQQGVIVFWNPSKGYGFVQSEGQDIFVHMSEAGRDLKLGERISFVAYRRTNGTAAGQVRIELAEELTEDEK